jgi:hypothetical protein
LLASSDEKVCRPRSWFTKACDRRIVRTFDGAISTENGSEPPWRSIHITSSARAAIARNRSMAPPLFIVMHQFMLCQVLMIIGLEYFEKIEKPSCSKIAGKK